MSPDLLARLREAFSQEARDHLNALNRCFSTLEQATSRQESLRRLHTLKGGSRAAEMPEIEKLCHLLETVLTRVENGAVKLTSRVQSVFPKAHQALEDSLAGYQARRPPPRLNSLMQSLSRLAGERARTPRKATRRSTRNAVRPSARVATEELRALLRSSQGLLTDTAECTDLFEELLHLSRTTPQLRPWRDRIEQLKARLQNRAREVAGRTSRALMAPAEEVLGWLGPSLRELAENLGKEVDFVLRGGSTTVEVPLLEDLFEPLLHLVRNSVHHGLESPTLRREAGKSPQGRLSLTVKARSGWLYLNLEDDGRGLDLEALRRQLGVNETDPASLLALARQKRVSTALEVDAVAGRGLGLTAAYQKLEELGGRIEFSQPEHGVRWRLAVPTAQVAESLLLVECSGHIYALVAHDVEGLLQLDRAHISGTVAGTTVRLPDGQRPLVSLAARLGLPPGPLRNPANLALLEGVALEVDSFVETAYAMVRTLELPGGPYPFLSGAFVRTNGQVCLVLDPDYLAQVDEVGQQPQATQEPPRELRVLLVDDSETSRLLFESLLSEQNCQVLTAPNGLDALRVLAAQESVDLVLSDLQMPQMDGLELTRRLREEPRYQQVPVCLMTSSLPDDEQRPDLAGLGLSGFFLKTESAGDDLRRVLEQVRARR